MGSGYRVLETIALADTAFEVWGDSPSELFEAASLAVIDTMVAPSTVGDSWSKEVTLQNAELSELLFDWLSHIVFVKDAEAVLFQRVHCEVRQSEDLWQLDGTLTGAPIDPETQELHTDVKAVTKHLYDVREVDGQWRATIVLDV